MGWIDEETVESARKADLLTYLQEREPYELVRIGLNEHRTATHGRLVILNDKRYWNRGGFGGTSALDYPIKVQGMAFVEAVKDIMGSGGLSADSALPEEKQQVPAKKWTSYPPRPRGYGSRGPGAVSYLQARGVSPQVIKQTLQAGIFYERRYYNPKSEYHHAAVCVFAGKDETGKTVFAALRGIDSDLKIDMAVGDKRFNFCILTKNLNSRHLAVFEALIGALSHVSFRQRNGWKCDGYRLSLGGASDVVLIAFLERNSLIKQVILYLDNDAVGFNGAWKIKARLEKDE